MKKNISKESIDVLKTIYSKLYGLKIIWILTGSTSLIIRGVDVIDKKDIDILTDKAGAKKIDEIFSKYRVQKLSFSSTKKYKSYFGKYKIKEVNIDIMGEFQYKLRNKTWSKPNQLNNIIYFKYKNMQLPVLRLEQELKEYENMDRKDKADKIKEVLR